MISKSLTVLIVVLATFQIAKCELKETKSYKICDPSKTSGENASECPKDAQCIDIKGFGNHTTAKDQTAEGLCSCKANLTVNPAYKENDKTSPYCIERKSDDSHTTPSSTTHPPSTQSTVTQTPSTSTTKAPVVTTQKQSTSSSTSTVVPSKSTTVAPKSETTTAKSDVEVKPAPEPQKGFFGSILIPVMIVLGLIGFIFVARKYNMVDRTRNYIRNRGAQQHQTRYDGLENDFDDDPLLI